MIKFKTGSIFIGIIALLTVSACSTIKSWFPDKEKDYQYTVEIPPLNVPPDLGKNDLLEGAVAASSSSAGTETPAGDDASAAPTVSEPPVVADADPAADKSPVVEEPVKTTATAPPPLNEPAVGEEPAQDTAPAPPVVEEPAKDVASTAPVISEPPVVKEADFAANHPPVIEEPVKETASAVTAVNEAPAVEEPTKATAANESAANSESVKVELVKSDTGAEQLRIGAPLARAWRIVGKALSRKSIEVTERNQEESRFVVQYDPDEKAIEDETLWDEAVFMFSGFQSNEKEYMLQLTENNRQTDVMLLDEARKPLINDNAGLKLLTLLQETIKADK